MVHPLRIQLREVVRVRAEGRDAPETDVVVVEEPLEIRVNGRSLAVIMRTPGDDAALTRGFLLTEGMIQRPDQIADLRVDAGEAEHPQNVVEVTLTLETVFDPEAHARNFFATSSCGICGKSSLESVRLRAQPLTARGKVRAEAVLAMPGAMRERQKTFDQTGSNHAAALFDREARLIDLAEDIGRHNAVDKVIGRAAERSLAAGEKSPEGSEKDRVDVKSDPRLTAWPLGDHVLFVSGRISFEITQKALMAGIGVIGAVSGVSSLAVDLAEEHGMTIAGFVRGDSMTVYAGAWRVVPAQG